MSSASRVLNHYEVLGVERGASADQVKKAYRNLAMVHHPDRGGNEEMFKRVSLAYDTLKDEGKRKYYDSLLSGSGFKSGPAFGSKSGSMSGSKSGFGSNFGPEFRRDGVDGLDKAPGKGGETKRKTDFSKVFSEKIFDFLSRRENKEQVTEHTSINVTLEDIFSCAKKRFKVEKTSLCHGCEGLGGKQVPCLACDGTGYTHGAAKTVCEVCDLKGFTFDPVCSICRGSQTLKISNVVTISLRPGIDLTMPIDILGVLDNKDAVLVVHLKEEPHARFKHVGDDLFLNERIHIGQALGGQTISVRHVDGQVLNLSFPGIIRPGDTKMLRGQGCFRRNGKERANLYITFAIDFPLLIEPELKRELTVVLNKIFHFAERGGEEAKQILLDDDRA